MNLTDEKATDEVGLDAIARQMRAMTAAPRLKLTVQDVTARRLGRFVVITLHLARHQDVTLRITRKTFERLYAQIGVVLQ